jgi:hypothetical protein
MKNRLGKMNRSKRLKNSYKYEKKKLKMRMRIRNSDKQIMKRDPLGMRNKNYGNFEQHDENDEQKNEYEEVLNKNKNDEQKC